MSICVKILKELLNSTFQVWLGMLETNIGSHRQCQYSTCHMFYPSPAWRTPAETGDPSYEQSTQMLRLPRFLAPKSRANIPEHGQPILYGQGCQILFFCWSRWLLTCDIDVRCGGRGSLTWYLMWTKMFPHFLGDMWCWYMLIEKCGLMMSTKMIACFAQRHFDVDLR